MDYSTYTRPQIESALTALKVENATYLNTINKLKKELKSFKLQCSSFESDTLDKKTVARRFNVN